MESSLYDLTAHTAAGGNFDFSSLKDNVVLIVNTASKCGFTPQYKGLEALHKKYGSRKLSVIGFPCDQFAHQEPGSEAEIVEFCRINHGVTFTLMSKVDVNGEGTHPVFRFLKSRSKGLLGESVRWNFTKFLVSKDGVTVRRYAPTVEPLALSADIEKLLAE